MKDGARVSRNRGDPCASREIPYWGWDEKAAKGPIRRRVLQDPHTWASFGFAQDRSRSIP